jgi:hypothetical protein
VGWGPNNTLAHGGRRLEASQPLTTPLAPGSTQNRLTLRSGGAGGAGVAHVQRVDVGGELPGDVQFLAALEAQLQHASIVVDDAGVDGTEPRDADLSVSRTSRAPRGKVNTHVCPRVVLPTGPLAVALLKQQALALVDTQLVSSPPPALVRCFLSSLLKKTLFSLKNSACLS